MNDSQVNLPVGYRSDLPCRLAFADRGPLFLYAVPEGDRSSAEARLVKVLTFSANQLRDLGYRVTVDEL